MIGLEIELKKIVSTGRSAREGLLERKVRVIYGDISQRDTLLHANIEKAEVLICTLPDSILKGTTNERLVRMLHGLNPKGADFRNRRGSRPGRHPPRRGRQLCLLRAIARSGRSPRGGAGGDRGIVRPKTQRGRAHLARPGGSAGVMRRTLRGAHAPLRAPIGASPIGLRRSRPDLLLIQLVLTAVSLDGRAFGEAPNAAREACALPGKARRAPQGSLPARPPLHQTAAQRSLPGFRRSYRKTQTEVVSLML